MVGNGEGLDRAARWLNRTPGAAGLTVATWYPAAFAPFFRGTTLDVRKQWSLNRWPWAQANRVVLYINQFQRGVPEPRLIRYFAVQTPLHTVRLHGVDYARIYPGPIPLSGDLDRIPTPLSATFGDRIRLLGYELITPRPPSGGELAIALYWEILALPPLDATVYLGLRDDQGNLWGRSDAPPLAGYLPIDQMSPGMILRDVHRLSVLPGTPPGRYTLELGWFSAGQGQALEARDAAGIPRGAHIPIAEIEVTRPAQPPPVDALDITHRQPVDVGPLRLLGYDRPTGPLRAGEAVPLTLFWQRRRPGDADFRLALRLRQGDQLWERRTRHPLSASYPPDRWQEGEIVRQQWRALLPAQAPSGRYALSLRVTDAGGSPVADIPLGQVEVVARPHRFERPSPRYPTEAVLGERARLLGYDLEPMQVTPGEALTLTLYWQALAEMETAYKAFVHLIDPNGRIRGQRDQHPLDGQAPTTSWVPGEVLRDRYRITLSPEAPPGRYTLRVGLYDPLTWQRLPRTAGPGGADYIELDPGLEVSP